jgi:hypothetical protein
LKFDPWFENKFIWMCNFLKYDAMQKKLCLFFLSNLDFLN